MLRVYCDAAGKDETEVTAVAGFIGYAEDWLRFDKDWDVVLRKYNLRYFHMAEFAQSRMEFRGWDKDETRRRQLLNELVAIIVRYAKFWIGACVYRKDYFNVDNDYELHERYYPYPLCGGTCVSIAEGWREAHHLTDLSMEYIFEGGDEHRGQLMKLVEEKTGNLPIFRQRLKAVPLQAADFAVYELAKMYRSLIAPDDIWQRFRSSFGLLKAIPNQWGNYDEQGLRVICRMNDIPRRKALPIT
jgi:hypothetical protein